MTERAKDIWKNYPSIHDGIKTKFSKEVFDRQCKGYHLMYEGFLPKNKNIKILDFGCGTGDFLYYLKQLGYKNYFGLDVSSENVKFVKKYITKNIIMADGVEYLMNKRNYFDLIILNDVLEHISKDMIIALIKRIYQALKPKGILICRVPNMENPITTYRRWSDFTHEVGFTCNSLKMVIKMGGFFNVNVYPYERRKKNFRIYIKRIIQYFIKVFLKLFFQCPKKLYLFHEHIIAIAEKNMKKSYRIY